MGMTVRDTTMLYISQMMGKPVVDTQGEKIGTISDLAISTGEVFPRITSLAFQGPGKVPFMISWRKYVDTFDEDGITLNAEAHDIRFSYLQPDEVLLARDVYKRQGRSYGRRWRRCSPARPTAADTGRSPWPCAPRRTWR